VDFTQEDSTDPSKYTWVLVKGAQGPTGAQGIAGQNGANGQTSYLHIAYATSADGSQGFDVSVSTGKTYIGTYVDFTQEDLTDRTKYTWAPIQGDNGDTGVQGLQGIQGPKGDQGIQGPTDATGATTYFHIKYSIIANSSTNVHLPTETSYWKQIEPWTDNPQGVSLTKKYEYISKRTKANGVWGDFSVPTIWACYPKDAVTYNISSNPNVITI